MKYLLVLAGFISCQFIQAQNPATVTDNTSKPKLVHFDPSTFSNLFSLNRTPVLTIHSGDTVVTETIDAFGRDKNGVKRQRGGNPLTGPFYIENAKPGDVLAITLTKVALNRSSAYTTESFASRSMPDTITKRLKEFHVVKWKLDREKGIATPDSSFAAFENLSAFSVPVQPFLGCIGVAPDNKKNEILSFFQGPYGGNLDYNRITQGATLYLPVFHEGGFFYVGDGHAVQGDGEIAGNALETSLDVFFTINLIKKEVLQLEYPRLEDATYIMAIGTNKKLEQALKIASTGLLNWLQQDYHLTLREATQVMSTTIEYTIAEIADPEVVVVAKIKKERLLGLKKYN